MFGFFHRNKGARPIFEALGADMHCHLIPNVDDGSRSMEETMECLQILKDVGYKKTYITPHFQSPRFPNKEENIVQRFHEVQCVAQERGLDDMLVGIAGEYRIDSGFPERIKEPNFLTIKEPSDDGKGLLLVELSLHQRTLGIKDMIFDLQMKEYTVVLAHPERYPYMNVNGLDLRQLKEMGVLLQLNLLSLDGFYGEGPMRKAYELLDRGWVELMGTDTHNPLYGQALIHASNNRRIEKILNTTQFLNTEL